MERAEQITIKPGTYAALQALADEQQCAPEELAGEALQQGIDLIHQKLFFERRIEQARARGTTLEDAMALLRRAGNMPHGPGDELPEGR